MEDLRSLEDSLNYLPSPQELILPREKLANIIQIKQNYFKSNFFLFYPGSFMFELTQIFQSCVADSNEPVLALCDFPKFILTLVPTIVLSSRNSDLLRNYKITITQENWDPSSAELDNKQYNHLESIKKYYNNSKDNENPFPENEAKNENPNLDLKIFQHTSDYHPNKSKLNPELSLDDDLTREIGTREKKGKICFNENSRETSSCISDVDSEQTITENSNNNGLTISKNIKNKMQMEGKIESCEDSHLSDNSSAKEKSSSTSEKTLSSEKNEKLKNSSVIDNLKKNQSNKSLNSTKLGDNNNNNDNDNDNYTPFYDILDAINNSDNNNNNNNSDEGANKDYLETSKKKDSSTTSDYNEFSSVIDFAQSNNDNDKLNKKLPKYDSGKSGDDDNNNNNSSSSKSTIISTYPELENVDSTNKNPDGEKLKENYKRNLSWFRPRQRQGSQSFERHRFCPIKKVKVFVNTYSLYEYHLQVQVQANRLKFARLRINIGKTQLLTTPFLIVTHGKSEFQTTFLSVVKHFCFGGKDMASYVHVLSELCSFIDLGINRPTTKPRTKVPVDPISFQMDRDLLRIITKYLKVTKEGDIKDKFDEKENVNNYNPPSVESKLRGKIKAKNKNPFSSSSSSSSGGDGLGNSNFKNKDNTEETFTECNNDNESNEGKASKKNETHIRNQDIDNKEDNQKKRDGPKDDESNNDQKYTSNEASNESSKIIGENDIKDKYDVSENNKDKNSGSVEGNSNSFGKNFTKDDPSGDNEFKNLRRDHSVVEDNKDSSKDASVNDNSRNSAKSGKTYVTFQNFKEYVRGYGEIIYRLINTNDIFHSKYKDTFKNDYLIDEFLSLVSEYVESLHQKVNSKETDQKQESKVSTHPSGANKSEMVDVPSELGQDVEPNDNTGNQMSDKKNYPDMEILYKTLMSEKKPKFSKNTGSSSQTNKNKSKENSNIKKNEFNSNLHGNADAEMNYNAYNNYLLSSYRDKNNNRNSDSTSKSAVNSNSNESDGRRNSNETPTEDFQSPLRSKEDGSQKLNFYNNESIIGNQNYMNFPQKNLMAPPFGIQYNINDPFFHNLVPPWGNIYLNQQYDQYNFLNQLQTQYNLQNYLNFQNNLNFQMYEPNRNPQNPQIHFEQFPHDQQILARRNLQQLEQQLQQQIQLQQLQQQYQQQQIQQQQLHQQIQKKYQQQQYHRNNTDLEREKQFKSEQNISDSEKTCPSEQVASSSGENFKDDSEEKNSDPKKLGKMFIDSIDWFYNSDKKK